MLDRPKGSLTVLPIADPEGALDRLEAGEPVGGFTDERPKIGADTILAIVNDPSGEVEDGLFVWATVRLGEPQRFETAEDIPGDLYEAGLAGTPTDADEGPFWWVPLVLVHRYPDPLPLRDPEDGEVPGTVDLDADVEKAENLGRTRFEIAHASALWRDDNWKDEDNVDASQNA